MKWDYTFYRGRINENDLFEKIESQFEKVYEINNLEARYRIYYREDLGFLRVKKYMNLFKIKYVPLMEHDSKLEKEISKMFDKFEKSNGNTLR